MRLVGTLAVVSAPRCPSAGTSRSPNLAVGEARSSTNYYYYYYSYCYRFCPSTTLPAAGEDVLPGASLVHRICSRKLFRHSMQACSAACGVQPQHVAPARGGITQRGGGSRGSARVHRFEMKQVCDPVRRREVSDTLRAPLHTASVETRKEQLQSELAQHK